MRDRRLGVRVAALCVVVAAACGGQATIATARSLVAACSERSAFSVARRSSQDDAESMLAAVNAQRRERGLRPLTLDSRLSQAATVQARYLSRTRRLDHRGPDGSRVGQRVDRTGYRWSTVAENLALAPKSSPRAVVEMWMRSRGHRENLLNRDVTQMGIAHLGDIWVQVLARPR